MPDALELTADTLPTDVDILIDWATQGFAPGVRAWTLDGARVVASPALSGRDRLAVTGPAEPLAALVRLALAEVGPDYRPFGDRAVIERLAADLPELEVLGTFHWMAVSGDSLPVTPEAHWLDRADLAEAAALLDLAHPTSYAHPDRPGATRWAGVRDEAGRLTALACEAWSSPGAGFMAGVVAHPEHGRGRGHAEAACRLVLDSLLRRSGRAALMVEAHNAAAIRLYGRLGMAPRELAAAHVPGRDG
ncbi:GNAT family N-acetyltransferase [Kitasatospora viridis]|uniref:Acetyltransferase (GNAT) family protein n=1 Tax=Kitasatospora viridis TaxID=281105 RepID=A0A561UDX3_9ACTN|nr:GNAT family N-acetyltransferase [Kitasatospora viridis]TWF97573.1 acetyltransferase (GNAT) family protein [Kitasatospora viridis]